jgi:hypothetical protein
MIDSIMKEETVAYYLPSLPLPVSLKEYSEKIREKARKQANNMAEVDRLLKQKHGTEKQMQYRRKQEGV